jgi:diguanylate cyclase
MTQPAPAFIATATPSAMSLTTQAWPADGAATAMALVAGTLEHSPLLVGFYDPNDVLQWANASFRAMFLRDQPPPVTFADVLRQGFHGGYGVRIDSGDIEAFLADILPRRGQQDFRALQVDTVCGRWLWMTETRQADGWMLCVGSDITSLKQNERVLRHAHEAAEVAARTDALTLLPNRRHLMEHGEAALARCQRLGKPCCLAVLDLDHFKQVNDRLGHAVGDQVLQAFAHHARAQLRQGDFLARLGGEEFVLVAEGTHPADVNRLMTRWRERWEQDASTRLPPDAGPCHFSAGLALNTPGDTLAGLLQRADQALYRAKQTGRRRTVTDWGDLAA